MGDIRGTYAGSNRYGVWFKYGNSVDSAFANVRQELLDLIETGERDDYVSIRNNKLANNVKYKILAMYYPYKYLTIYSDRHLSYFCDKAGIPTVDGDDELVMPRKLIQWKESNDKIKSFSYLEFVAFLYHHFGHPPKADSVVKTKPKLKELKKKLKDFDGKHPKKMLTESRRR